MSTANWKPCGPKNPCPICGGMKNCSVRGEAVDLKTGITTKLASCRGDANSPIEAGWTPTSKRDKSGGLLWRLQVGEKRELSQREREEIAEKKRQKEIQDAKRRENILSDSELNAEWQKAILPSLELLPHHRQELKRRGLSDEQINHGQFKSVRGGARLDFDCDNRVPGINTNGRNFCQFPSGYLCLARNIKGEILGAQIRSDTPERGKYCWLSSMGYGLNGPQLKNGELPLNFAFPLSPSKAKVRALGMSEGLGKSFISAQLLGIPFVGASGGNFLSSEQQLRGVLTEYNPQIIKFFPDAGCCNNPIIYEAFCKAIRLCVELGYNVRVADFGQWFADKKAVGFDKAINAIDDYLAMGGDKKRIKYRDANAFLFAKEIAERKEKARSEAISRWQLVRADIEINARFLPEIDLTGKQLIACRSDMGTGKTSNLIAKESSLTIEQGRRVVMLTDRIALGRKLAHDLGLGYLSEGISRTSEISNGEGSKHKANIDKILASKGEFEGIDLANQPGYVCCFNSFHPYGKARVNLEDLSYFDGILLILDECEQVSFSIVNAGKQVGNSTQNHIIISLTEVIKHIIKTGGKVIIGDAQLSHYPIHLLEEITGIKAFIINNKCRVAKEENRVIVRWDRKNLEKMLAYICDAVRAGKRVWIQTDSQKARSSEKRTAQHIYKMLSNLFPEKKGILLDAETIGEENNPACGILSTKESLLRLKQFDFVVASPSVQSGISIEFPHFDIWFGICTGYQPPNNFIQSMGRIRFPIERHICVGASNGPVRYQGNLTDGLTAGKEILLRRKKSNTLHYRSLQLPPFADLDANIWARFWAASMARLNLAGKDIEQFVIDFLLGDGYRVIDSENAPKIAEKENETNPTEIVESLKEIKATAIEREVSMEVAAPLLTDFQLSVLQNKHTRTQEEKFSERKTKRHNRYGVPVNPVLIELDSIKGWRQSLQNDYYRTRLNQIQERDRNHYQRYFEKWGDAGFLPHLEGKSVRYEILASLGLERFMDPEKRYHKGDSNVLDVVKKLKALDEDNRLEFQRVLGIELTPDILDRTPLKMVKTLMLIIGHKMISAGKVRHPENPKQWIYYSKYGGFAETLESENPDLRQEIFKQWDIKFAEAKAEETKASGGEEISLSAIPIPPSEPTITPPPFPPSEPPTITPPPSPDKNAERIGINCRNIARLINHYCGASNYAQATPRLAQLDAYLAKIAARGPEYKKELWAALPRENREFLKALKASGQIGKDSGKKNWGD